MANAAKDVGSALAGSKNRPGLAQAFAALATAGEQDEAHELDRRLLDFKLQSELDLEEQKRAMPEGGAGFTENWRQSYLDRAKAFVGDRYGNIPRRFRDQIDTKLASHEVALHERAQRDEWAERDRKRVADLDLSLRRTRDKVAAEPDRIEEFWAEGKHLIETSILPSALKAKAERGYREELEYAHASALIDSVTNVDDYAYAKGVVRHHRRQPIRFRNAAVNDAIQAAAKEADVDPATLSVFAKIESGGDPRNTTGSYKGLFQLSNAEFRKHGGNGDIYDPVANARAAAFKLKAESDAFRRRTGRDPSATDLYLIHQQGEAGAAAHAANPNRPAWENMASTGEGREKGAAWAKAAIWGNIPNADKRRFGSVENVTSADFIKVWDDKIARFGGGSDGAASGSAKADPDANRGPYRSLSPEKLHQLDNRLEAQWARVRKAIEQKRQQRWVDGVLAGTEHFNSVSSDGRKLVDERVAASGLGERITEAKDVNALVQAVHLTSQLRYTPKPIAEAVLGKLRSNDPMVVAQGYSIVDQLQFASPHALSDMPGYANIIDKAVKFRHYNQIYGGPAKALQQMAADEDPEKKRLRKAVDQDADKFVKDTLTEDRIRGELARGNVGDWLWRPELGVTPTQRVAMLAEFREVARRYYEDDPNPELAIKQAANRFRLRHGVSDLLGKKRVMAYPPESFWPPVDGSYDYMTKDIRDTVAKLEPEADKASVGLQFADWGADGKPRYWLSWRKKDGRLEVAPRPWAPGYTEANKASEEEWLRRREAIMRRQDRLHEEQPQDDTAPRRRAEGWRFYEAPPGRAAAAVTPGPDENSLGHDEWMTVP
jgi:hypothetical protein